MILTADIPGERLDAFLARCAENLSRSAAQKLIDFSYGGRGVGVGNNSFPPAVAPDRGAWGPAL